MTTTDNSRADALTDIDSWAEGAKFALRTIAKHDICFLTDSMKMTAVKLATEACVAEKERLLNEYPAEQHEAAPAGDLIGPLRDDQRQHAVSLYLNLPHSWESAESVINSVCADAYTNGVHDGKILASPSAPLEGTGNGAQKARIKALRDAIEGECDGLAIDDKQAASILSWMDSTSPNGIVRAPRTEVAGAVAGWAQGVEAVAKMLDKKAADYVDEFGYIERDTGALSFGQGAHADVKRDYHSSLVELAEEVRAMAAPPSADTAAAPADCAHDYVRSDRVCIECGQQPAASAGQEAVAIPAGYAQTSLALLPRVADLLHLLSFATIHTPSEGDARQVSRAIHDIKVMIEAAPPAQVATRQGLTDERILDEFARKGLNVYDLDGIAVRPLGRAAVEVVRALLEGAKHE